MSRILISGATGFIGKALATHLISEGHTVSRLTRQEKNENGSIIWDPEKGKIPREELEGFDYVVHLAGDPFTIDRWSEKKKQKILSSRVEGTRILSQALANVQTRPKTFISASAVGFYGDQGETQLTEESPQGRGFLAHVCHEWEKASQPLRAKGVRTVQTRFGMVIGPGNRAIQSMILPFKFCLGGAMGSGKQWISWIDRDDLIRAIEMIFKLELLEGPVNLVSPNAVRQEEFSKIFAKLLHRPSFMKMPAWMVRLQFGILADEMLLASTKVYPEKLLSAQFKFKYPHLIDSLRKALKDV